MSQRLADPRESLAPAPAHRDPHDPLGFAEIAAAARIVCSDGRFHERLAFIWTALEEPSKQVLEAWRAHGNVPPRQARVAVYDRDSRTVAEVLVDLDYSEVVSFEAVADAQPPVSGEEHTRAIAAVRGNAAWRAAVAQRGVDDLENVLIQAWPPGYPHSGPALAGRRIANAIAWVGTGGEDNAFARPLEGLVAFVDLDTGEVIEVTDDGVVAVATHAGNYLPELTGAEDNWPRIDGVRDGVRPIEIVQPDGPSFSLEGHTLRWHGFEVVVGFTPREGIVLHRLGWRTPTGLRPILHRASLSEMWVPYGDPAIVHRIKNVFDEGECGLGRLANPLRLGCDCLGEIRYLDGVVNDESGDPVTIENAICIHEEDIGVAWKHTTESGAVEVRRARRLVISSWSTIGNYDYGFFWYLGADGSIGYEVKLTGVVSTGAAHPGEQPPYGALVAPGVYGPNHQHWFCVRLDTAVGGDRNSVYEVDAVLDPPGPGNAHGNAWRAQSSLLASERLAQRETDPRAARTWLIANDEVVNALGRPVAYQLVPGPNPAAALHPDAPALQRALFSTRALWVTAFDAEELFAAGAYPYGTTGGDGLPAFAAGDRNLAQADTVVWHSFAAHHVARPEDWPVMPVTTTGFHLRPFGFFDANPILDLPRPQGASHCHHH